MGKVIRFNGHSLKPISKEIAVDKSAAAAIDEWRNKERSIAMTNEEWGYLLTFLRISKPYFQNQLDAWEELSKQNPIRPDGSPIYPHAKDNHEKFRTMKAVVERFASKVEGLA